MVYVLIPCHFRIISGKTGKVKKWDSLSCHDFRGKFNENPQFDSGFIRGYRQTNGQMQVFSQVTHNVLKQGVTMKLTAF
jgi:hypothetical protein